MDQILNRIGSTSIRCCFAVWASVVDAGPALKQHWMSGSCLLGCELAIVICAEASGESKSIRGNILKHGENKTFFNSDYDKHTGKLDRPAADAIIKIIIIIIDRQIDRYFIDRKKVNPDLFVIEIEICTCIYNVVNLLKSYDNIHSMTYITKIMLTGIAIRNTGYILKIRLKGIARVT